MRGLVVMAAEDVEEAGSLAEARDQGKRDDCCKGWGDGEKVVAAFAVAEEERAIAKL